MEITETIGKILKAKREERGISLEVIAQKTKININILKHLESDQLDKLPNKTYVRGFVSNYARTVGWSQQEAKEVLDQSYHQFNGTEPTSENIKVDLGTLQNDVDITEENEELKETFISIIQSFFNKKVFVSVVVVLVLTIIGKYVVTFFSTLNYEHKKIASTPLKSEDSNILEMEGNKKFAAEVLAQQTQDDQPTEKSTAETNQTTSEEENDSNPAENAPSETNVAVVTENPDEKTTQTEESEVEAKTEVAIADKTEEKVKEEPQVVQDLNGKLPFKKFYQAPLSTFEVVTSSEEESNPQLLPPTVKQKIVEGQQNVYVVATEGDTWIAFKSDDKPIRKYVLKQGKRVLIRGEVVTLFMGNYNVTKVFYNNQLIKANTKTGVKSLIFPKQAGKDLKLPLFPTHQGKSYTSAEYIEKMIETQEI